MTAARWKTVVAPRNALAERGRVADVRLDALHVEALERGAVLADHASHPPPGSDQRADEVGADVSGRTGDDRDHGVRPAEGGILRGQKPTRAVMPTTRGAPGSPMNPDGVRLP